MNKTDRHTLLGIDKQILRETSAIVDFIYRIYPGHMERHLHSVLDIWKDTFLDIWKDTILDIWKDIFLNS